MLRGRFNGSPVGFSDEDTEKDSIIGVITDFSNKRNMEILIQAKDTHAVYSQGCFDEKEHHKIVILNENMGFTDLVFFDSKTLLPPTKVFSNNVTVRQNLRNLGFGLMGAHSKNIYELLSKREI